MTHLPCNRLSAPWREFSVIVIALQRVSVHLEKQMRKPKMTKERVFIRGLYQIHRKGSHLPLPGNKESGIISQTVWCPRLSEEWTGVTRAGKEGTASREKEQQNVQKRRRDLPHCKTSNRTHTNRGKLLRDSGQAKEHGLWSKHSGSVGGGWARTKSF